MPALCLHPHPRRSYAPDCEYYKLRGTAAVFSVACVLLVYLLSRRLGGSPVGASVSAALIALDMLNVTEGRLVLMDSQASWGGGGVRHLLDDLRRPPPPPAAHVLDHRIAL